MVLTSIIILRHIKVNYAIIRQYTYLRLKIETFIKNPIYNDTIKY